MAGTVSPPRALLFDWDNTLVDTWPVIHEAMNTTLAAMDCPLWTIGETRERVHRSLREAFPDLFGDRWEEARDIFYGRFREIHIDRLAICPGAEKLLSSCSAMGLYLGVVSNKMGDHLRREAAHLGWDRYFSHMIGATDAARDKPALDPVLMALEGSGLAPGNDVWFVGDTVIDMECAHNADCIAVLIRDIPPGKVEFGEFYPQYHFSDCHELLALVLDN